MLHLIDTSTARLLASVADTLPFSPTRSPLYSSSPAELTASLLAPFGTKLISTIDEGRSHHFTSATQPPAPLFDERPLSTLDDTRVARLLVDRLIPKDYYPFLGPLFTPAHMSWSTDNLGSIEFITEIQTYLSRFTRNCIFALSLHDSILPREITRDILFPTPIAWCERLIRIGRRALLTHHFFGKRCLSPAGFCH
jgi:hypothetical protein